MADAGSRYRPNVGLALFNGDGLVFVGRRKVGANPGNLRHAWQMPQGGIDPGETPYEAALRELHEETNVRSVVLLAEAPDWLAYDIPTPLAGLAWKGRYTGQRQKWFAFRFIGDDSEIDVEHPGGGKHKSEFVAWRWEKLQRIPELIVPFKRQVYEEVAKVFSSFARPAGQSPRD
jgi:putative (di)nucleoside polyphosphate hydrolase